MNVGVINKPHSGLTLRVWQIADAITEANGKMATRKEVLDAFTAEGGNPNTASTQYYYWKAERFEADQRSESDSNTAEKTGNMNGSGFRIQVDERGRLTLPQEVLRNLGIERGGNLSARVKNGELRLSTPHAALKLVQAMLEPLKEELENQGISLSSELIADRRAEAKSDGDA
jgi:bifunctional DNA-binding transcriptional regulator/antitoxin component of YhaV-PrlF toxin-antitoxin module